MVALCLSDRMLGLISSTLLTEPTAYASGKNTTDEVVVYWLIRFGGLRGDDDFRAELLVCACAVEDICFFCGSFGYFTKFVSMDPSLLNRVIQYNSLISLSEQEFEESLSLTRELRYSLLAMREIIDTDNICKRSVIFYLPVILLSFLFLKYFFIGSQ